MRKEKIYTREQLEKMSISDLGWHYNAIGGNCRFLRVSGDSSVKMEHSDFYGNIRYYTWGRKKLIESILDNQEKYEVWLDDQERLEEECM